MRALVPAFVLVLSAACGGDIYVRDGVTDGDSFYLADHAFTDADPVLQSWVAYSLARSTCQLEVGGENPARVSTYGCEFTARRLLLDTWAEKQALDAAIREPYLDDLLRVREAGYLDEYTVRYFGKRNWQVPAEVDVQAFRGWQKEHLRGHRPQTRIIGSWNYAHKTGIRGRADGR